jgi:hypothetical protein
MNYEITDNNLKITINNKDSIIDFNSPIIERIKTCVQDLVQSLQENNYDWKKNNNQLVFNLVKETLKLVTKYKKMTLDEKKEICFKLIEKLIEEQIGKLSLDETSLASVQLGIDTIVEPIIELALLTILKKIQLTEKCLKCL